MAITILHDIIAQGEGYFTEFKRNINSDFSISNPGGLPKGMPEKDFGRYSLARNATLANLMQRVGYIEKLGTGITRIRQELEKAGIPEVKFSFGYFFSIEFKRYKSSQKSSQKILEFIKQKPEITIYELSSFLEISERAIKKHLFNLKKSGLIERFGPDKGGFWKNNQ